MRDTSCDTEGAAKLTSALRVSSLNTVKEKERSSSARDMGLVGSPKGFWCRAGSCLTTVGTLGKQRGGECLQVDQQGRNKPDL